MASFAKAMATGPFKDAKQRLVADPSITARQIQQVLAEYCDFYTI